MPAAQILDWVDEAVSRLQGFRRDIVLTDLPLTRARRLSSMEFLAFRSLVVPQCRLSLAQVMDTAERVNVGLQAIAVSRGVDFFQLKPEWYGIDPIHIRPSQFGREQFTAQAGISLAPGGRVWVY